MPRQQSQVQTGLHAVMLFDKTSGVVDSLDPTRVMEDGITVGENVVIDLSGGGKRRSGSTILATGSWHSLFSCGEYGLGVVNGVLAVISSNNSVTSLGIFVGNSKVSYAQVFDGTNNVTYFSCLLANGRIINKLYSSWTTSAYVGVSSTESMVIEYLSSPPLGHILEVFAGRMYVAVENLVYVSEVFDYSRFRVIPFVYPNHITMVKGLTDGIFVGTTEEVYFHSGTNPWEFSMSKIYSFGAIAGTDIKVTASDILLQTQGEVVVFSVFGEGICKGDNSGSVLNLTKLNIAFPESRLGACCVTDDKQYIVSL